MDSHGFLDFSSKKAVLVNVRASWLQESNDQLGLRMNLAIVINNAAKY